MLILSRGTGHSSLSGFRLSLLLTIVALTLGLLTVPSRSDAASARQRQALNWETYTPGKPYGADFPDPSVIRVGRLYYAHATTTRNINLPTLVSANLRVWKVRPATPANPSGDGLLRTARWSDGRERADGRFTAMTWAPTVTRLGPGRYVLAYATKLRGVPDMRMCVSIATGRSPLGPFVDRSRRPTVCPRQGAIDPQVFKPRRGRPWLIWKVDRHPARIYTRAMNRSGTRILKMSRRHLLARVAQRWEGRVIENPGMIRYRGRYYLFYSGNGYASRHYAIGYLICKNLYGGCTRPRKRPLLASHGAIAGQGGAAPFVDRAGRLRLAYHAWRAGNVGYAEGTACRYTARGCGQRRMYIATVKPGKAGRLHVVRRR